MNDIVYIRQKYKEITGNANADDVPIYAMQQVVKAYQQGRAEAIEPINAIIEESERMMWCADKTLEKINEMLKEQTK